MENREAIEYINWMRDKFITNKPLEACDLAISALEFRERYDKFWEEVKAAGTKGKETEIHHGGRVFRIREVAQ
jgi:hypothetical protein